MPYLQVKVKDYLIVHGFDEKNNAIEEPVAADKFTEKLINIDRILSVSEKYILTQYAFDRIIYWEYEGGLKKMTKKFKKARLLIAE